MALWFRGAYTVLGLEGSMNTVLRSQVRRETLLARPAHQLHGRTTLRDRVSGSQRHATPGVILADKEDGSGSED